jgi:ribosomal protein S18 acetylase RimI-like enzyme
MASDYLPTLYKNRTANRKQHVCAICLDRTRGKTQQVDYGYGVTIYLCQGHASPEFQRQRGGRDLYTTLYRTWRANGCLTTNRSRALDAH